MTTEQQGAAAPNLLPCPFCLGTNVRVYLPTCTRNTPYNPADRAFPVARCPCGAEKAGEDWDQGGHTAVAAWNRRAQPTPPAVVEPLTSEQLQHLHHIEEFGLFCDYEEFEQIARAIEFAHGIGIKKGGSNGN